MEPDAVPTARALRLSDGLSATPYAVLGRLLWTARDQKNREVFMLREGLFDSSEGLIILIPLHRLHTRTHWHIPPIALLADAWRHTLERRNAGMLIFDVLVHRLGNGLLVWFCRLRHLAPPHPAVRQVHHEDSLEPWRG